MSVLCGVLNTRAAADGASTLGKMLNAAHEAEFDRTEHWSSNAIALGQHTFAITPEAMEHGVLLRDELSDLTIVFDGRLDYREELADALDARQQLQWPDTHLLIRAYQKWGERFIDHIEGEFAFVLWDGRQQVLLCVTDAMGTRPLYYQLDKNGQFSFSTDIRAIVEAADEPPALNEKRLAQLALLRDVKHVDVEQTHLQSVFRIPGATVLKFKSRQVTTQYYWQPEIDSVLHFESDEECREAYQDVFSKAIATRTRSVHKIGAMLSGGLDSSGIVGMASHNLAGQSRRLQTFSSIPTADTIDVVPHELEFIKQFENHSNLDMHYVTAEGKGPFDELQALVNLNNPLCFLFQHFLFTSFARAAHEQGVRVMLDGFGGETSATCYLPFMGYFSELLLNRRWGTLRREMRALNSDWQGHLTVFKRYALRPLLPHSALKLLGRGHSNVFLNGLPFRQDFVNDVLGSDVSRILDEVSANNRIYPNHRCTMAAFIRQSQGESCLPFHGGYLDHHKIRSSFPYLDKRVIQFCISADERYKYYLAEERRLMRVGMSGLVPEAILHRNSKNSFSPDYMHRFLKGLPKAKNLLSIAKKRKISNDILDIERVELALGFITDYNLNSSSSARRNAMFVIPSAAFWSQYLQRY